jgi:hypothetical protein
MSFMDIEETGVRPSAAEEAVVGREKAREAAAVEIWGANSWAE